MRRFSLVMLAAACALASACAGSTSSATEVEQPLPTIGLGSEIAGGRVSGGADVRVIDATEIDTVVMIGDSITVASTPALEEVYEELGFTEIVILSEEGKRTAVSFGSNPSGAEVADALLSLPVEEDRVDDVIDHSNELWVVALGTNDINQYSDPAERAAAVNEMLAAVPDNVPLIWVDTYFRDAPDGTAEMNATIEARVEQRGNSTIAPWSDVADDDGNLRSDGVHPRDQGSIVFANTVAATIIDFLELG